MSGVTENLNISIHKKLSMLHHLPTRLSSFYFKTLKSDLMYLSFTHRKPSTPDYYPPVAIKQGLNERNKNYHLKVHIPKYRHVPAALPDMTYKNVPELNEITLTWQYSLSTNTPLLDDQLTSVFLQQLLISGIQPKFIYPTNASMLYRKLAGRPHGVKTTLTGPFMYDFMDKLTALVIPKWKNFYGFNKGGNHQGDFELKLPDNVVGMFPELELAYDQIPSINGQKFFPFQILFKSNAVTDWQVRCLLSSLGLPFIDEQGVKEKQKLKLNMQEGTKTKKYGKRDVKKK
eukprot:NODE_100_length_20777_cov_0.240884.p7 type:complete len:288 gc:universal NODE_100_length_20777_cov_0.240884:13797-12934(-)